VARWGESVQHFGCAGVRMDPSARLYLCARCRVQVVLCRRCDRGNRYCGRACSRQAREDGQRLSARRYQCSRRGRIAHAQRSRLWRERLASREARDGAADDAHNVTHQGSHSGAAWAPLVAWTRPSLSVTTADMPADFAAQDAPVELAPAATPAMVGTCWTCRRCGAQQGAALRLGFVRHGVSHRRRHDHSP